MYLLGGLVLICLGLLMLLQPEAFYELTEGWKHRDTGGPSRMYIFCTKIGGVFMTAAGLLGVVVQLIP